MQVLKMTNTSNAASANMGWEIAGGKKALKKPGGDSKAKGGKETVAMKGPKLEALRKIALLLGWGERTCIQIAIELKSPSR